MEDEEQAVRSARAADLPELTRLLTAAFLDDPVFGWCYPDPARRQRILPDFFRIVTEAHLAQDGIYTTEDHVAGAVWVPPEGDADEAQLAAALEEISGEDAPRCFELMELMDAEHPHEPHHYLWFLGTRPGLQSRGIGSALLRHVLDRCDRDGVPAYLEATSERNRDLYLRHGFEVRGEIRPPGGPTLWPMWRAPG